ncbi:MAG: hypothetical protein Kow0042_22210 [Calditrichia bacterium]
MVRRKEIKENYRVGSGDIFLTIYFGDAQFGSSAVVFDNEILGIGEINQLKIGRGTEIIGKTLKIKSTVTDVNDKTNHTSITYKFTGGVSDQEFRFSEDVEEEGDSIIYRAEFTFVS